MSRIQEIEDVPGVARASASIYLLLDEEGGMSMNGIVGSDLRSQGYETFELRMAEGRDLTAERPGRGRRRMRHRQSAGRQRSEAP